MNETNDKYSWDPKKREQNIKERGLDFVDLAGKIFADPNVVIKSDDRNEYGEDRYTAYGLVNEERLCVCFTPREDKLHLITIFRVNKRDWGKYYGKGS